MGSPAKRLRADDSCRVTQAVGAPYGPSFYNSAEKRVRCVAFEGARTVRSFGDPAFFRVFDLLLSLTNPGSKRSHWRHDGVDFERERHSVTNPRHGLAIEIFTLTLSGRRGWSFMVIKEYWWAGEESKALKNLRWSRPTSGQRGDILAWLRAQEAKIGSKSFLEDRKTDVTDREEPAETDGAER
jgi:hypothetical protein